MKRVQVSVVVPMHNEEANLPELHARLSAVLHKVGMPAEIIYVDDGSTDGTLQLAETLRKQPQAMCVRVVHLPKRQGKTAALSAGFAVARGSIVVTTDADLQEPPEVLPLLLDKVSSEEVHLVVAWRQQRQDSPSRVWASRLFNTVMRWLTGVPLHDANCGTKAMHREVAQKLQRWMVSDMHRYLPFLAARMGYRVVEIPVPHVSRRRGRSRFGASRYLRALGDFLPISLLWWRGWEIWFGLIGLAFLLSSLGYSAVGFSALASAIAWLGWALILWLRIR